MKPSPKKETARVQIPNQPRELPKATVRLQPAPPSTSPTNPTTAIKPVFAPPSLTTPKDDSLSLPLSIGTLVFSLFAFLIQLWIYLSK